MRNIRIVRVGVDKNQNPFCQGAVDMNTTELQAALQIGASKGIAVQNRAFGIINGLPADKIPTLKVGDYLEAEDAGCTVASRLGTYTPEGGEERETVNHNITLSGKVKRVAAPVALCEW